MFDCANNNRWRSDKFTFATAGKIGDCKQIITGICS